MTSIGIIPEIGLLSYHVTEYS